MTLTEINYPVRDLLSQMTCKVTLSGIRVQLIRLKIAQRIIALGVWITGMRAKIEIE